MTAKKTNTTEKTHAATVTGLETAIRRMRLQDQAGTRYLDAAVHILRLTDVGDVGEAPAEVADAAALMIDADARVRSIAADLEAPPFGADDLLADDHLDRLVAHRQAAALGDGATQQTVHRAATEVAARVVSAVRHHHRDLVDLLQQWAAGHWAELAKAGTRPDPDDTLHRLERRDALALAFNRAHVKVLHTGGRGEPNDYAEPYLRQFTWTAQQWDQLRESVLPAMEIPKHTTPFSLADEIGATLDLAASWTEVEERLALIHDRHPSNQMKVNRGGIGVV